MAVPQDIVCIHGVADITGQWRRSQAYFESHGFHIHFFEYPTLDNFINIPAIVDSLASFITEKIGSSPFYILAHSQGGLIAEWFDRFIGHPNLNRIITVGTPYQGNSLPLLMPRKILEHLPVSRRQIEDLSFMSPVLMSLIAKRIDSVNSRTEYAALIGHALKLLNIESDGAVSVCSANPNAGYYLQSGRALHEVLQTKQASIYYVDINHLPFSIVGQLLSGDKPNPFQQIFLSALNGEAVDPIHTFLPSQCGLVCPANFQFRLTPSAGLKKIISRPTLDGKYLICYFNVKASDPYLDSDEGRVHLSPGQFTYVLESSFLSTRTLAYSSR